MGEKRKGSLRFLYVLSLRADRETLESVCGRTLKALSSLIIADYFFVFNGLLCQKLTFMQVFQHELNLYTRKKNGETK